MVSPTPYLALPGTAAAALGRYREIFGGEVTVYTLAQFGRDDGPADAVAHGELVGPVSIFASDAGEGDAALQISGLQFALLGAADPTTSRAWFDALAERGTVLDPLQERPWGDHDGQVRDEFGVTWLIGFSAS